MRRARGTASVESFLWVIFRPGVAVPLVTARPTQLKASGMTDFGKQFRMEPQAEEVLYPQRLNNRIYLPFVPEILAMPSGLTETNRPGWLNMSFACEAEISLPNRNRRLPCCWYPLAHLANSSGVGV